MRRLLERLRACWHPLWRLRRTRTYRWLLARCDVAVAHRLGRIVFHSYLLRDFARAGSHVWHEPRTCAVFTAVLERFACECFVDVGANLGSYSWLVANRYPAAQLMLFEPDAKNLLLLRKTIARSGLAAAELFPVALSERRGQATFIVDDASGAVGSLIDQRGGYYNLQDSYGLTQEVTVETRCLDEFTESLRGRRVLLKVDVEGAEALVFAGAARVLAEVRPIIFLECFDGKAVATIAGAGYHIYPLGENSNYVAVPEEDVGLVHGLDFGQATQNSPA